MKLQSHVLGLTKLKADVSYIESEGMSCFLVSSHQEKQCIDFFFIVELKKKVCPVVAESCNHGFRVSSSKRLTSPQVG